VTFTSEALRHKLAALTDLAGEPGRLVIAYSGGLDSTVLLHALAASRDVLQKPILAVHVDHGLHKEAANWSGHCHSVANALDIDCCELPVNVDAESGAGPEAAARDARYAAFRSIAQSGDWLLSAHHKDDQAETLLLNLMRGSGPAGLAGIGEIQPFASGWLVRPLLSFSRSELQTYAKQHDLDWIDDPSNEDCAFDRNYLRHEVMPLLEARWPDVASRLKRSAVLAGEAATLLDQLADSDFNSLQARPDRLPLAKLRQLPLQSIVADLIPAREDAQPLVKWPGVEVRRYRDQVYVLPATSKEVASDTSTSSEGNIVLPPGLGELEFETGAESGLSEAIVAAGVELRFRSGGEEIKLAGQSHTRKLKKLLQEEGFVPWMRDRLPLLDSANELVAVGDLWIAAHAASEPGISIRWKNRPPIH
jgi:tRNA(Ile)-lysidine synthase